MQTEQVVFDICPINYAHPLTKGQSLTFAIVPWNICKFRLKVSKPSTYSVTPNIVSSIICDRTFSMFWVFDNAMTLVLSESLRKFVSKLTFKNLHPRIERLSTIYFCSMKPFRYWKTLQTGYIVPSERKHVLNGLNLKRRVSWYNPIEKWQWWSCCGKHGYEKQQSPGCSTVLMKVQISAANRLKGRCLRCTCGSFPLFIPVIYKKTVDVRNEF